MKTLQSIYQNKIVAVIRNSNKESIEGVVSSLLKGGINTFEITAETPDFLDIIKLIRVKYNNDNIIVGAGTILDSETARLAIINGAQFIFSPTIDIDTIKMTKRYGAISIPGAMTPTEVLSAYENGADIIKIFPASNLGPSYIKNILGPLPHIPLMPTGGINLNNIKEYFDCGAVAVGLGGALINLKQEVNQTMLKELEEKASAFKRKIN